MLQLLELLAEPEVAVGGHDPVVLPKVLQLHGPRCLDDRVRKTHLETENVITMFTALTVCNSLAFKLLFTMFTMHYEHVSVLDNNQPPYPMIAT